MEEGTRLRHIALALTLVLLNGVAYAAGPSYPPYPDIWEWQARPDDGAMKDMTATLLSNGDVLIRAVYESHGQKMERYHLMFDPGALDEPKTKAGRGATVLRDGSEPTLLEKSSTQIELADGTTIDQYATRYRACYRGPARDYFWATDSSGRELARKSFFYLLAAPTRFAGGGGERWFDEPNASCPTEGPLNLETYVESISAELLPLRDGTFLMILPEHASIVRLTRDLTSRASLFNDRVFAFDYHDDPMIVSELTHKQYGSTDDFIDQQQYQNALDDFRDYLSALRGRRTRAATKPVIARFTVAAEGTCSSYHSIVVYADGLAYYSALQGSSSRPGYKTAFDAYFQLGPDALKRLIDDIKRSRLDHGEMLAESPTKGPLAIVSPDFDGFDPGDMKRLRDRFAAELGLHWFAFSGDWPGCRYDGPPSQVWLKAEYGP